MSTEAERTRWRRNEQARTARGYHKQHLAELMADPLAYAAYREKRAARQRARRARRKELGLPYQ